MGTKSCAWSYPADNCLQVPTKFFSFFQEKKCFFFQDKKLKPVKFKVNLSSETYHLVNCVIFLKVYSENSRKVKKQKKIRHKRIYDTIPLSV